MHFLKGLNLITPPYYEKCMEAVCGHWKGASSARCEEGRQLGEGNTYPAHAKENIPTDFTVTHMEGSRDGCPINTTALRSVMANWSTGISIINVIRKQYIEVVHSGDENRNLSYLDLFLLTKICNSIPAYLLRTKNHPISNGNIPSPIATIYKVVTGVHTVIGEMIMEGDINLINDSEVSSNYFYMYADTNNHFLSRDGNACGGPKRKIIDLINYLKTGEIELKSDFLDSTALLRVQNEIESIFNYGLNSSRIDIAIMYYNTINLNSIVTSEIFECVSEVDNKNINKFVSEKLAQSIESFNITSDEINLRINILDKLINLSGMDEIKIIEMGSTNNYLKNVVAKHFKKLKNCAPENLKTLYSIVNKNLNIIESASAYIARLQKEVHNNLGITGEVRIPNKLLLSRVDGIRHYKVN